MTAPRSELDQRLEQLARAAREAAVDPSFGDDLAPARPAVWLVLAWICIVAVFVLLFSGAALANPPPKRTLPSGDVPGTAPPVVTSVTNAGGQATAVTSTTTTNNNTNINTNGASSQAGAMTGPVTAGNQLGIEMKAAAYAPDVISYPTAPCRIAVGASGGGIAAVIGLSFSVEDEGCTLRETSRQLWNVGQRDAAVQVMCLNADARLALEASGVACKVARPAAAEKVAP